MTCFVRSLAGPAKWQATSISSETSS